MANAPDDRTRCAWPGKDLLYVAYHDDEWGVPEHDDLALYEKLVLDGFQAGLSWITILRRRDGIREAFRGFDPEVIARFGDDEQAKLLQDTRIIRNRAKVAAAVANARAFLLLRDEGIGFGDFLWQFTGGTTLQNRWKDVSELPAQTPESRAMSKELIKRGFKFCGPTICYAFMQAIGMVNDHVVGCFRHSELGVSAPLQSGPDTGRPALADRQYPG